MKQLSKHDVNKLSVAKLAELAPFQITSDGVPVLAVIPVHDVNKLKPYAEGIPKATHDVNRTEKPLTELPLSKKRQANGRLSDSFIS